MSKSSKASMKNQNAKQQRAKRKYVRKPKPEESAPVAPVVEPEKPKRRYIQNVVVIDHGVKCPHCGNKYDHEKKQKYPNNMQRYICRQCHMPFIRKTEE